jgi:hypothetical protein
MSAKMSASQMSVSLSAKLVVQMPVGRMPVGQTVFDQKTRHHPKQRPIFNFFFRFHSDFGAKNDFFSYHRRLNVAAGIRTPDLWIIIACNVAL